MSVGAILAALSAITNAWGGVATAWQMAYAVLVVLIVSRAIPRAAAGVMLVIGLMFRSPSVARFRSLRPAAHR